MSIRPNPRILEAPNHQAWDGGTHVVIEFAVPHRGAGVLDWSEVLAVPGELASPYLSAGLCRDRRSERRPACRPLFSVFFCFFGGRKNGQKTDRPKIDVFRKFWRFWCLRRRFFAIFGLKTGSRRLFFRCCFENGDFAKIVLPLWK